MTGMKSHTWLPVSHYQVYIIFILVKTTWRRWLRLVNSSVLCCDPSVGNCLLKATFLPIIPWVAYKCWKLCAVWLHLQKAQGADVLLESMHTSNPSCSPSHLILWTFFQLVNAILSSWKQTAWSAARSLCFLGLIARTSQSEPDLEPDQLVKTQ